MGEPKKNWDRKQQIRLSSLSAWKGIVDERESSHRKNRNDLLTVPV